MYVGGTLKGIKLGQKGQLGLEESLSFSSYTDGLGVAFWSASKAEGVEGEREHLDNLATYRRCARWPSQRPINQTT
jgi:hypothetical protein